MDKKQLIEATARQLAKKYGLINITRKQLCDEVGIPDGNFMAIMGESFTDFIAGLKGLPLGEPTNRKRTVPDLRKKYILKIATDLAKTKGYNSVTFKDVSVSANVSTALAIHYFPTINDLRSKILENAIASEIMEVVAQGLANGDPLIQTKASDELKQKTVNYLAGL